jgi:hypothetical protein
MSELIIYTGFHQKDTVLPQRLICNVLTYDMNESINMNDEKTKKHFLKEGWLDPNNLQA